MQKRVASNSKSLCWIILLVLPQLLGCISDHPTLLHEHTTKTDTGGIRVHCEMIATL